MTRLTGEKEKRREGRKDRGDKLSEKEKTRN
jgi:hypothetical protein